MPVSLTITEVTYGGRGFGKLDGKACFVSGVLPGETVEVEIVKDRGTHFDASLTKILSPSPHRIAPSCPLAGSPYLTPDAARRSASTSLNPALGSRWTGLSEHGQPDSGTSPSPSSIIHACPGCRYQHASYEEELRIKQHQLKSFLIRQAGCDTSVLLSPVGAPRADGYRSKMALHAQADGKDMRLGYFMEDNTTILDIPACPLAVTPLNTLLAERRADKSFLKTLKDGMTVTFRWTERDGAVWWRNRAAENDVWLIETSVIGPLSVPRNSFYQMNPVMADKLVGAVTERLKGKPPQTVVDLYCGVGIFALAAATLGIPDVLGVDLDGPGIRAAEFNARKLGLNNTRWLATPAHEGIRGITLTQPDQTTVIVDPPRNGLGRKMIQDLVKLQPARILYVSCAPDTMTRDAAWLNEEGYGLLSSQLFDLFPRTAHFESLTEFVRGDAIR